MAKLLNLVDTTNILARTTLSLVLSAILSFIIFPISFIALIGIYGLNTINFEYITQLFIGSCAFFGNFFSWLISDYKLLNYKWLTGLIIVSILSAYIGSVKGMNAERSILPFGVPELRDTFIWCTLLTSLWSTLYWTVMKILNKTVRL